MLWSAQEISKKFRNSLGKNISPRAIHVFAEKLGYHMKRIGGKKGYDQSLYTAITRHLKELLDYDSQQTVKTSKKPRKQSKEIVWDDGNYEAYNGERDSIDYEWEKNENRNMNKVIRLTEQDLHRIVKESVAKIVEERLVPYNNIMQLYDTGCYTPEQIADELGEDLEYVNWCIDNFDDSDFGHDEVWHDEV